VAPPTVLQMQTALKPLWLLQSVSAVQAPPMTAVEVCAAHEPEMQTFPGVQSKTELQDAPTALAKYF